MTPALAALVRLEEHSIAALVGEPFADRESLAADLSTLRAALEQGAEAVEVLRAYGTRRAAEGAARKSFDRVGAFHDGESISIWEERVSPHRAEWHALQQATGNAHGEVCALADRLAQKGPTP